MPVVDTLRLKTRLSESGMPESQAQVLVEELDEVLSTAITAQVATRADISELRADFTELRADFTELRADVRTEISGVRTEIETLRGDIKMLRWMGGFVGAGVVAVLVRLFFM